MAQLLRIRMQCKRYRRCGFDPWVRKIPWRRAWQPTPVFLPGKFHKGAWHAIQSIDSQRVCHDWVTEHIYIQTLYCGLQSCPPLHSTAGISLLFTYYPTILVFSLFPEQARPRQGPMAFAPVGPPSKNSPLTDFCMADLLYLVGFNWNFTSQGSSLPILHKTAFSHLPLSCIALITIRNYLLICWLVITGLIPVLAKLYTSRNFASFT